MPRFKGPSMVHITCMLVNAISNMAINIMVISCFKEEQVNSQVGKPISRGAKVPLPPEINPGVHEHNLIHHVMREETSGSSVQCCLYCVKWELCTALLMLCQVGALYSAAYVVSSGSSVQCCLCCVKWELCTALLMLCQVGALYSAAYVVSSGSSVQCCLCCVKWELCTVLLMLCQVGALYSAAYVVSSGSSVQCCLCCVKWELCTALLMLCQVGALYSAAYVVSSGSSVQCTICCYPQNTTNTANTNLS